MQRTIQTASLLLALAGCSTPDPVPALPGPATVAVLPFEGNSDTLQTRDLIRGMLDAFLQGRGVLTADLRWVDQHLAALGFEPSEDDWIGEPESVRLKLQNDGFTYMLRGTGFEFAKTNAGVVFLDQLSARFELYHIQSGELVWETEASSLEYGGVLLETGQVITGFRQSFDRSTNGQQLRLGVAICQDALDEWPGFESTDQLVRTALPEVTAVRAKEIPVAEDSVPRRTLDVLGTTTCAMHLRLPDGRQHPFLEVQQSLYRAHFELTPLAVLRDSQIVMTNRFGLQTRVAVADWLAPPEEAPKAPESDGEKDAGEGSAGSEGGGL